MQQTLVRETPFHTRLRWCHSKKGDGDPRQNWHVQGYTLPVIHGSGKRSGNDCQGATAGHPLSDLSLELGQNVIFTIPKLFQQWDAVRGQKAIQFVSVRCRPRTQVRLWAKRSCQEERRPGKMLSAPLLRAPNFFQE